MRVSLRCSLVLVENVHWEAIRLGGVDSSFLSSLGEETVRDAEGVSEEEGEEEEEGERYIMGEPDGELVGEETGVLGVEGRGGGSGGRGEEGDEDVAGSADTHCHREGFESRFLDDAGRIRGSERGENVVDNAGIVVVSTIWQD